MGNPHCPVCGSNMVRNERRSWQDPLQMQALRLELGEED